MCNCFETQLQEIDLKTKALSGVLSAHSLWSDNALNFTQNNALGLSVTTNLQVRKSKDKMRFELQQENSFIPLSFCPFCGEKLDEKELPHTQEEDDALLKIFYTLEENLENRLENLTVKNMDEAITLITEEMDILHTSFFIHKDETREMLQVLHKGNLQDYSIEVYLELDEEENIYTLSVF